MLPAWSKRSGILLALLLFPFGTSGWLGISEAAAPLEPVYRYTLQVDGRLSGEFLAVSWIGSEHEVVEKKVINSDGAETVQKLPGRLRWFDISLARPLTDDESLWQWRREVEQGSDPRVYQRPCAITVFNLEGVSLARWDMPLCWPVKIEAGSSGGAILETVTLVASSSEHVPDSDGDGVPDQIDGCPADGNKTQPGLCGCGVADADSDKDGTPDCRDACPVDPSKTTAGLCGCGRVDVIPPGDVTGDGIISSADAEAFAVSFGTLLPDPRNRATFDCDTDADGIDLAILAGAQSTPSPR